FVRGSSWQNDVRALGSFRKEHVLHDHKCACGRERFGLERIRAYHPQHIQTSGCEDLVIRQTVGCNGLVPGSKVREQTHVRSTARIRIIYETDVLDCASERVTESHERVNEVPFYGIAEQDHQFGFR